MKKFNEQAGSVVFTFGRFNPPTTGHEKLLDKVKILYADDYLLWDALSKTKSGWLHGKEIAATLNPSCSAD